MNLQLSLLLRIVLITLICLLASASYVVYQTDHLARQEAVSTAERIDRELYQQIKRIHQGYDHAEAFPDIRLWQGINGLPGSCISFESISSRRQRNLCQEVDLENRDWPLWFGQLYQQLFNPHFEVEREVVYNAFSYGRIIISLNQQAEISRAWQNLQSLMGVTMITVLALSMLFFVTVSRILRPAKHIVKGLEKMRQGDLAQRLPRFDVAEWRRTSNAINALAESQQNILNENKELALKLINVQEEEHRYIARELHDEFGQCLSGINAVSASIRQTAREDCPAMLDELERIQDITEHMMTALRNLQTRLRPIEIDDIGLQQSLKKLVKSWNQRSGGGTQYLLNCDAMIDQLPEPLPVNLYRIVQESLTNIAKHANATQAEVHIAVNEQQVQININDNGDNNATPIEPSLGVGLLGIRERVSALGGEILIARGQQHGWSIQVKLPINHALEHTTS
ncbi:histidine kinase [Methylophaga lonarensis]|uniref:sensor histidine kinase n=1 Tax=Methylophaga lonarensis TaxID=999151 RepID=UPI003D2E86CB